MDVQFALLEHVDAGGGAPVVAPNGAGQQGFVSPERAVLGRDRRPRPGLVGPQRSAAPGALVDLGHELDRGSGPIAPGERAVELLGTPAGLRCRPPSERQ